MKELIELVAKVPSEAWIGLIGAVVGAVLSLLGSWLTSLSSIKQLKLQLSHQERVEHERAKQERLEELYMLIGHWSNEIFGKYLYLTLVMKGQNDYNNYLNYIIENSSNFKHDFNRIEMIVDLYGNELKEDYLNIIAIRDRWNKIESEHKKAYKSGEIEATRFLKPSADVQLEIGKAVDDFRKKIAKVVRNA